MQPDRSASARLPPTEPVAMRLQGWERQFGRGHAVGFFSFLALFVIAGVAAVVFQSTRWLAVAIGAFGGGWAFGIAYTAFQRIGIGWGSVTKSAVLLPDRHRVAYWLLIAVTLTLSFGVVGFGVWLWVHADAATKLMVDSVRSTPTK